MRVLGIDPGLQTMGWGVIEQSGSRLSHIANGICTTRGGADLSSRLLSLFEQLTDVVARYAPDEAAVEKTFVNKDGSGTLKLGQARGIAMLVPAMAGLAIAEYAPNAVKKTVIGAGHGDKDQIRAMVKHLLPKADPGSADAADALAIAITHAHSRSWSKLEAAVARADLQAKNLQAKSSRAQRTAP